MENVEFNKKVFTVCLDSENQYYIEENVLADRIMISAEECTSPKGVMPRLHTVGTRLMWWEVDGHERLIETYDTEEEAEQDWYNRTYEHDYMNSDYCYVDYDTELDAKVAIAENLTNEDGITRDVEYVDKMLDERLKDYHATVNCLYESLAANLQREWDKAKQLGHPTKALIKAYDAIALGYHSYHDAEKIDIKMIAYNRSCIFQKMYNECGTLLNKEKIEELINK